MFNCTHPNIFNFTESLKGVQAVTCIKMRRRREILEEEQFLIVVGFITRLQFARGFSKKNLPVYVG